MVIHLAHLNSTRVDAAAQTIEFGGGCDWTTVYEAAWKEGFVVVGGTVGHTGVGGLILHGGFGWTSGKFGLSLDCLLEVEAVLADGNVVVASEHTNPDLFWAMRGAGAGFAIVTRFKMRAFPAPPAVWYGGISFPLSRAQEVLEWASIGFYPTATPNHACTINVNIGADAGVYVECFYYGTTAEARSSDQFAALLALGPEIDSTRECTFPDAHPTTASSQFSQGERRLFSGATLRAPFNVDAAVRAINELSSTYKEPESLSIVFEMLNMEKIASVPVHSTACANRSGMFNIGLVAIWLDADRDDSLISATRAVSRRIRGGEWDGEGGRTRHSAAGERAADRYVNYANEGVGPEDAFGENAARLQDLKAMFDPGNVFSTVWGLGTERKE
jgi:FAD/FMN-containing dehydrogenase